MHHTELSAIIDAAWENRAAIDATTKGEVREAVAPRARPARHRRSSASPKKGDGGLARQPMAEEGRTAVVPAQRHRPDLERPRRHRAGGTRCRRSSRAGARPSSAPPVSAPCRTASCAAAPISRPSVVLMPSFVNLGAYVDSGTMVDTWATVGSCAQIGKNVHLSGGVGIGGVLEPLQADPTIIEDNCFIGARSEVVEGVHRGRRLGDLDGRVHRRVDQDHRPRHRRGPSSARCRPIRSWCPAACPASRCRTARPGPSLYCAVIVKTVDAQTRVQDRHQRTSAGLGMPAGVASGGSEPADAAALGGIRAARGAWHDATGRVGSSVDGEGRQAARLLRDPHRHAAARRHLRRVRRWTPCLMLRGFRSRPLNSTSC